MFFFQREGKKPHDVRGIYAKPSTIFFCLFDFFFIFSLCAFLHHCTFKIPILIQTLDNNIYYYEQ